MKYGELPNRYKQLVDERSVHSINEDDRIGMLFLWNETPEGSPFWSQVDEAETVQDLPPLPLDYNSQQDKELPRIMSPDQRSIIGGSGKSSIREGLGDMIRGFMPGPDDAEDALRGAFEQVPPSVRTISMMCGNCHRPIEFPASTSPPTSCPHCGDNPTSISPTNHSDIIRSPITITGEKPEGEDKFKMPKEAEKLPNEVLEKLEESKIKISVEVSDMLFESVSADGQDNAIKREVEEMIMKQLSEQVRLKIFKEQTSSGHTRFTQELTLFTPRELTSLIMKVFYAGFDYANDKLNKEKQ